MANDWNSPPFRSRPPVQQHSNDPTYMATLPQPGETLYEWATTDYFQMNEKMWLKADISIDHTLKVMPTFKNFRSFAKIAENDCNFCHKINMTRPPGAPKIPCIISVSGKSNNRCALCVVAKKKGHDCQGNDYVHSGQQPRVDQQQFKRYFDDPVPIAASTQSRIREKSLQLEYKNYEEVEADREARKKARLSLAPDAYRLMQDSLNTNNEVSRVNNSIPGDQPVIVTKTPEPSTVQDKRSDQAIPHSEVQKLLLESKRLVEEGSVEKGPATPPFPPPSDSDSEVDELLQETDVFLPQVKQEPSMVGSDDSVLTSSTKVERRRDSTVSSVAKSVISSSSRAPRAGTEQLCALINDDSSNVAMDLLKPLQEHFKRKDQKIATLMVQLEEERKLNGKSKEIVNDLDKIKQKFSRLQEDYKLMKAEKDRTNEKNKILREEQKLKEGEIERLTARCKTYEETYEKCYNFLKENGLDN